jgi:hypothetical protein
MSLLLAFQTPPVPPSSGPIYLPMRGVGMILLVASAWVLRMYIDIFTGVKN